MVRIDDDGNAYGAHRHGSSRKVRHFLFDLHPSDGVTASLQDGALRFELGTGKWAFRVNPADPDVVRMAFQRTKTRELDLERADEQTCASRLRQLTPPADAPLRPTVAETIPDEPDHWAIGPWTATRPTGLAVELGLFDVVNGRGHGIHCNLRDGPTYTVLDVHPDNGLNARVTRNKVTFRIDQIRFAFKKTGDDTVEATRRHKGRKTTVDGLSSSCPCGHWGAFGPSWVGSPRSREAPDPNMSFVRNQETCCGRRAGTAWRGAARGRSLTQARFLS